MVRDSCDVWLRFGGTPNETEIGGAEFGKGPVARPAGAFEDGREIDKRAQVLAFDPRERRVEPGFPTLGRAGFGKSSPYADGTSKDICDQAAESFPPV